MKLPFKKYSFLIVIGMAIFAYQACENNNEPGPGGNFDRSGMLENMANNVILPNYDTLVEATTNLKMKVNAFNDNPDQATLTEVQISFNEAYKAWQHCSLFEFGPAGEMALRQKTNTFPTDSATIEDMISQGNTDLSSFTLVDAKGFPALDYLLFNKSKDQNKIINGFTIADHAANRRKYLNAVVNEMLDNFKAVSQKWQENYFNTFINSTGTDQGSSIGMLVNELNFDLEIVKNPKIGIPLGKKSLGEIKPKNVEGYYSENSVALAVENLKSIQNVYLGKGKTDGKGLDEYLRFLEAKKEDKLLADVIQEQLNTMIDAVKAVPSPLPDAIRNQKQKVETAHEEIQRMVTLFKTDMTSAMGVLITYQDNDGD